MRGIQADEVAEIIHMAREIKSKSDNNKILVFVAIGYLGHKVAQASGKCVPLREQVNKQLKLVNARHAAVGVSWLYEKETLIVTFK
ncbi:hypothetical protein EHS25_006085 [Saitozyma podzolica]|uniref:Uncharacterized protein n=1 Tax=Saitozyma podzolica TaxID=1890683 RepID=A0A427XTC2_9TREE|nr:hypothetical protein EHS25_006085 [Saitozyma podzolica]